MTNEHPKERFPAQTLMSYRMIRVLDEIIGTVQTLRRKIENLSRSMKKIISVSSGL